MEVIYPLEIKTVIKYVFWRCSRTTTLYDETCQYLIKFKTILHYGEIFFWVIFVEWDVV